MAAVDVVMPAPPPPPPPAPAQAPVVRISRLTLAVADAVVCLWITSLWVLLASVAAAIIGGLACGSGCTGAAWTAVLVSLLFFAVVWPLAGAAVLLSNFEEVVSYYINQIEKGAAALEPISEAVVNAHLIAITAFPCLELLGLILLLDANDPLTARIASVITVLPPLGICVMCCLVSIPGLAVRVWRIIRHGRASVVPI